MNLDENPNYNWIKRYMDLNKLAIEITERAYAAIQKAREELTPESVSEAERMTAELDLVIYELRELQKEGK